ncbi:MAG: 3-hydroxyacyl-CoA dehydrogenase family protein [Acidobacteria bacterium]|nr:MAG: 3-hydroxyacyl-CoA dehydrogenase family protein [Acidobacteriota bacterium]
MAIERITIIGVGTMGHGIAQVAAAAGATVHMNDISAEAIDKGMSAVRANLDKGIEKGKVTEEQRDAVVGRLVAAPDLDAAAAAADLVIEAAPESLELKQKIFARIDAVAPAHAILASNTSSLPVTKIAAATGRPDKVLGMHFFNPVHIMKLLEIVRADTTSQETVDAIVTFGEKMGKDPIVVRDAPGFASSRLGLVIGLEAMRMLEQEVASPADIDKAMTRGYGHPMGPLKLTDLVGLDVRLAIAEYLHEELGVEAFRPPEILRRMVAEGKLGKKSGQGFYTW